jgi:uncharacterized damage-inducible protein DinB
MSGWREYFVDLAQYHAWANETLFVALDKLTEEQRKQDCGLFFHSIHHTVDHLLLVNRLWLGRLTGEPITAGFKTIQIQGWEELKAALRENLAGMAMWLSQREEAWFEGDITFAASSGKVNTLPVSAVLTHMLTHFNHHRGQVSAAISQLGGAAPEMDYVYYLRAKVNS